MVTCTYCLYCLQQLMPTYSYSSIFFSFFSDTMTPDRLCKVILPLNAPHCQGFCSTTSRWQKWGRIIKPQHTVKQKMCCFESLCFLQKALWMQGSSVPQGLKTGVIKNDESLCTSRSSCLILKPNRNNELKEDQKCKYVLWRFCLLSFRWHWLNSLHLAKRENKLGRFKERVTLQIPISFQLCSWHIRMGKVSGFVRQKGWGNHTVTYMITTFLMLLVLVL